MQNLANVVVDYLCFLEFSDDEDVHPDTAISVLEGLSDQIENVFSDDEKQALSGAAARRLGEHRDYLADDQQSFLQALVDGKFNGHLDPDIE